MLKSNNLILIISVFLLIANLGGVFAIDNFNISSSISSAPLFFLNGTSGDASFGFNVTAVEFNIGCVFWDLNEGKFYKIDEVNTINLSPQYYPFGTYWASFFSEGGLK